MKALPLVLAAALLSAGAALAAPTDTDGNGTFSIEEMKAAYPNMTEEVFKALDVDGNGQIDADELQAGIESGAISG